MKPISLPSGNYLIGELPEGAEIGLYPDFPDILFHEVTDDHPSLYAVLENSHGYPERIAELPPGKYSILATHSTMSEDIAAGIVEKEVLSNFLFPKAPKKTRYCRYAEQRDEDKLGDCKTALESFHSLLRSLGVSTTSFIILKAEQE